MNETNIKQATINLINAVEKLCPLGSNGFSDHTLWRILRERGDNCAAEQLTTITNEIRSAIYEAKKSIQNEVTE